MQNVECRMMDETESGFDAEEALPFVIPHSSFATALFHVEQPFA